MSNRGAAGGRRNIGAMVMVLAALLAAAPPSAGAAACLGGDVLRDTLLDTRGAACLVAGQVVVARGATLTVAPGSELRFAPGAGLVVEGAIEARGTLAAPVTFAAAGGGAWAGIAVAGPEGRARLRMVAIRGARAGLAVRQGSGPSRISAELADSLVADGETGVAVEYGAGSAPAVTVARTLLRGNGTGMSVAGYTGSGDRLRLDHNSFVGNGVGLSAAGRGRLRAAGQWWGSPNGPRACGSPADPGAGDSACGRLDTSPSSRVPAGRVRVARGQPAAVEVSLGAGASSPDPGAPSSVATLVAPAGAFPPGAELLLAPADAGSLPGGLPGAPTGLALEVAAVGPDGAPIAPAGGARLRLELRYRDEDLAGADPAGLQVLAYDAAAGAWALTGTPAAADPAARRVAASIGGPGLFRVAALDLTRGRADLPLAVAP